MLPSDKVNSCNKANPTIIPRFDIQGDFFHWASPKKLKYGKPRESESTLTWIVLDTPNLT